MLCIVSYNVKQGKAKAYQRWVKKNEKLLAKHAPKGVTLRGIYFYVLGGHYSAATLWELKKYGDFDTVYKHEDPVFNRLFEELDDYQTGDPGESVLLREAGDTRIWEKEK